MKITTSNTSFYEEKNIKNENNENIVNSITKKLLEKYKPEGIYNIKNMINTADNNGIA